MKYYLHDSNAFNDEKITELYIKFGYEGLGLFYTLLEKLAQQEKPIKTDILKTQLNVGKRLNRCWNFMEKIGIIHSNNDDTFSKQLLNFSENYQIKKQKNTERIRQWRENQANIKNVTCYEHVYNAPKVKRSKINIIDNKAAELLLVFKDYYYQWFKTKFGFPPKLDGEQINSLKQIIKYFKESSAGVELKKWKELLAHWDKLNEWHYKR